MSMSFLPILATCNSLKGCAINFAGCFAALHKFRRYKTQPRHLPTIFPHFSTHRWLRHLSRFFSHFFCSLLRPFARKYVYFPRSSPPWSHILCSCLGFSSDPASPPLGQDEKDDRKKQDELKPECRPELRATFSTLASHPLTFEVALLLNCPRRGPVSRVIEPIASRRAGI